VEENVKQINRSKAKLYRIVEHLQHIKTGLEHCLEQDGVRAIEEGEKIEFVGSLPIKLFEKLVQTEDLEQQIQRSLKGEIQLKIPEMVQAIKGESQFRHLKEHCDFYSELYHGYQDVKQVYNQVVFGGDPKEVQDHGWVDCCEETIHHLEQERDAWLKRTGT